MIKKLSYEKARAVCTYDFSSCKSTAELTPLKGIIGQDRAVKALGFGLDIDEKGFNIYVAGAPGTGRTTHIVNFLEKIAKSKPTPPDWCYVNNFSDSNSPNAIQMLSGMGLEFVKDMDSFITEMKGALRIAFESEDYQRKRTQTLKIIEDEKEIITTQVNTLAGNAGFLLQRTPIGLMLIPIVNGKPVNDQEFTQLPPQLQQEITARREKLQTELRSPMRQFRDIEQKINEVIKGLNKEIATFALEPMLTVLKEKYSKAKDIIEYLKELEEDILNNLAPILQGNKPQQPQNPFMMPGMVVDPTKKYKVNLVVDNSKLEGAPIILEQNPTYQRLFGATEKEARFGALVTDYTMIRAGTAHKANGGFLILPVEGIFRDPVVWESLKRTIANETLGIEEPAQRLGFIITKSISPEPIPFKAKIIIVGDPSVYQLLYTRDRDFKELFKVKADFDTTMDRIEENVKQYAAYMCTLCNKEDLIHLDPTGIATIIEYSSRLASDQEKMSTQFNLIADIIREANYYAKKENAEFITKKHVDITLNERVYRSNLIEKKIDEMITRGSILIEIKGEKVGQLNGLAVLSMGDYGFGKPSKITASVGVGKKGIIDIEREAQMGGPTHTKGVLILSGYLNGKYAQKTPLSMTARLVFEQNYSGVDGDSASSTELYCILSALSGIPIKQHFAVTGSVNQKGMVQAIGGVNEKIEGFYEVIKAKGMTGKEGVMIPASNVKNLMLKDEIVQAIRADKFHIYPVKTIDEGIEVLTGVPAGELQEGGAYPDGTINYLVKKRLEEMAEQIKEYRD